MIKKRWIIRPVDQEQVKKLAESLSLSPITAMVLWGRGIRNSIEARSWLSKEDNVHHDPFLFPDMERCVDRLHRAVQDGERVCFYGDYDVDGMCATSVHQTFFRKLGAFADIYIPHRQEEGYGMNKEAILQIANQKVSLMVTADCGSTSHREIELANDLGLDVIVTDHHQIGDDAPPSFAFLNPYRADNTYPFQGLCSAGLAYKLAEAYCIKYGVDQGLLAESLDLVALASVADVVPLRDENRLFVQEGLRLLTNGQRVGIQALKEVLGITESCTANTIGFRLAPALNAAGRLAHADLGVRILTTSSAREAFQLANQLEQLNRQRRELEQQIFQEATSGLVEKGDSPVIVVGQRGWHVGVVGIVASRLVERYHRPAVVVAFDEKGMGKGSARSVPNYNIYEALAQCQDHLVGFGGHPAAAGITIEWEKFADFKRKFCEVVGKTISSEATIPQLDIDANVQLSELSPPVLKELDSLTPFGMGNPEPTLSAMAVTVLEKRIVGHNHLKLVIRKDGAAPVECIGFRMGEWLDKIEEESRRIDVAFTPEMNRWKGYDRIQLRLKDVRVSSSP